MLATDSTDAASVSNAIVETPESSSSSDACVEALILNNFKSYKGRHVIGPFKRFTAVVGPNGSGKSNLMDAVAFVLGVQARHMRGSNLSDLIYRPSGSRSLLEDDEDSESDNDDDDADEEPSSKRRKGDPVQQASVTLILRISGRSISFSRKIVRGGAQSVTQIDSKTVSAEEYRKRLAEFNILVKARNFLVFQGDVTDVANKDPAERGKLFEQISGSDELKSDYEKYEAELKKVTSELKHETLNRQRCDAQRQDLEKQVSEVNEFRKLERDLQEARSVLLVYKLYINEVAAGETQRKIEEAQQKEQEIGTRKGTQMQKLRHLDATAQENSLEKQTVSQSVEGLTKTLAAMETEINNLTQKVNYHRKRRAELQTNQDQKTVQKQNKEEELQESREELLAIQSNSKELDKEAVTAKSNEVQFTAKQKKEYQRLKQQAAAVTAGLKASFTAWERQDKILQDKVKDIIDSISETKQQVAAAEEKEVTCNEFISKSKPEIASLSKELNEKEKILKEKREKLDESLREETRNREKKYQLESQLNRITAGRGEMERLAKRRQLISELRAAFPNCVYGPMNELHEPTQRKYTAAIQAALGKWNECIIVNTMETGKKAIDYLRRTRNPPLEFAPLDTVIPANVDPRINTSLNNLCKPALDCVQYDEIYAPAFRVALHDSVIVESLRVLEQVAYIEAPRLNIKVKVVTLDGEKALKNGNITIDASVRSSNRVDPREMTRITNQLEAVDSLLRQAEDLSEFKHAVNQSVKEVEELRDSVNRKKERLKLWEDKLIAAAKDGKQAAELVGRLEQERQAAEKELEHCQEELKRVEAQILTAEDDVFAPLAREVNVADLRKFEEEQRISAKSRDGEKEKLVRRTQKLQLSIRHLEAEIGLIDLQQFEKQKKENERNLKKDEKSLDETKKQKSEEERSLEVAKARLKELVDEEKSRDGILKKEREALRAVQTEETTIHGQLQQLTSQNDLLYKEAVVLLRSALLDSIPIPLAHGTLRGLCRLSGLEDVLEATANTQQSNGVGGATDSTGDVLMSSANGLAIAAGEDDNEQPDIDYDRVLSTEAQDSVGSRSASKLMEKRFEDNLEAIRAQLMKSTPNLRAKEKYDAVVVEMRAIGRKIAELERIKDKSDREFNKTKRERSRRFLDCFHQVKNAINNIYFRLTGGKDEESIGGQAFLELESGAAPPTTMGGAESFASGILYNVIPPLKRFVDLKTLSGGEKTMASLALLFALQSYHPAPFFVIDEIDADLDPVNVSALAGYLKDVQFQVIIISHCDRVFSQAEGLVGIYLDLAKESSGTLSIDLSVYPNV